jgi:hypothetical protein
VQFRQFRSGHPSEQGIAREPALAGGRAGLRKQARPIHVDPRFQRWLVFGKVER